MYSRLVVYKVVKRFTRSVSFEKLDTSFVHLSIPSPSDMLYLGVVVINRYYTFMTSTLKERVGEGGEGRRSKSWTFFVDIINERLFI